MSLPVPLRRARERDGPRAILLAAVFAALTASLGSFVIADDTEIFFARAFEEGDHRANVLFMFDISGSMGDRDGTAQRRIDRLKLAMLDILETTRDVDVGIGAFNGSQRGGAILYPTTDPDADACADGGCTSIDVRAPVRDASDDAEETPEGEVRLHSPDLDLIRVIDESDIIRRTYTANEVALQHGEGALDDRPAELPFFHVAGEPPTRIGLHVANLQIPPGATVLEASVSFVTPANRALGSVSARISVAAPEADGSGSPDFSDAPGRRIADRARLPETVDWSNLPLENGADATVSTPDLAALVGARVDAPGWREGDALSLLFEILPGTTSDLSNRRVYRSGENGGGMPTLTIAYHVKPPADSRFGLRFADLDVPRGARVRSAVVEFVPTAASGAPGDILVRAERSGDAATFVAANGDIGRRPTGSASVVWSPGPWGSRKEEEQTSDLSAVVQEVVNRSDWCGGNALVLTFEGSTTHRARSRDAGRWDAPVLKVSYEPGSVNADTTCVGRRTVSGVRSAADDVESASGAGPLDPTGTTLATRRAGSLREIGLRFGNVDVPHGASVTDARLLLSSAYAKPGEAVLELRVEPNDHAAPFDTSGPADIAVRTASAASLEWSVPEVEDGETLTSVNLAPLIGPTVARHGWAAGNALVLTLTHAAGVGERHFHAFESDGQAPRLEVTYRHERPGDRIGPLRTARDDLIDTVLGFRDRNGTPLVDAYYESALYMLGKPVDFGRSRGQGNAGERFYRLSSPSTYTGGSVYTPPGCSSVDPNAVACVGEAIIGEALYKAPPEGACHVNQIVLLSDGAVYQNESTERIRSLTGVNGCAARDNGAESCAFELAAWLRSEDEGRAPILTHTVGFNFTSSFLRDLAAAGGGLFQEADSAGELAGAFRTIIDEAASIDTGFVAPSATVSQFNRLANRDDVYYAMFRPSLETRWKGNLKRYRIGVPTDPADGTEISLVDALGQPALDPLDGGVSATARSYWTDGAVDGSDVAAGGAANELALPRALFTYVGEPGAGTELVAFSESNADIDAALLGIPAGDAAYRELLLKWARGVDVQDVDDDGDVTEVRREMGDPMHSTPFVLNYAATDSAPARSIVFVGTNEGFLHAIDTDDGSEVYGFIPPELLPNLDVFYRNESGRDRPYGLDGPIGGWFDDTNANLVVDPGEKAYVYVGMRRGGRNYYALDVSDAANPKLAWVVRGGEGDFVELGQSWSRPVRTRLPDSGGLRDVLVFGGGYDPRADARRERDASGEADALGRAIFIVDANTGEQLVTLAAPTFADMTYAIPSDVNVLDIDLDGTADMIWVGDMGGRIWRFDIDGEAKGSMKSAIGGAVVADFGGSGAAANRRFHYPPDLALIRDDEGETFLNVAIGSGWRAHPLDDVVDDRFYVLRTRALYGPPRDEDGVIDYTRVGESDLYDVSDGSTRDDTSGRAESGWYLTLPGSGEKVLGSALTVDRQLLFTTYLPAASGTNRCGASVGGGRFYALDAVYGDAALDLDAFDGESSTSGDRSKRLLADGIPPPVSAFISELDLDNPIGMVGLERIDELEFGPSLKRTYWTEE